MRRAGGIAACNLSPRMQIDTIGVG